MATKKTRHRKLSPLKATLAILGLFVAVSLLGGTAIWSVFGLAEDFEIDGRAAQVREVDPRFGAGWGAYGGDALGSRLSDAGQNTRENGGELGIALPGSPRAVGGGQAAGG
ncbi:MAG: hypothetical protein AB3N06_06270, partial [Erythrobacter sp.]